MLPVRIKLVLCWKSWNSSIKLLAWQASEGNFPVLYMKFFQYSHSEQGFEDQGGFSQSVFLLLLMLSNHLSLPMAATATGKKRCGINTNSPNIFLPSFLISTRSAAFNLGIYKKIFSKLPFPVRHLLYKASRYPRSHIKKLIKLWQVHFSHLPFLQKTPCTNQKNPSFGVFPGAHILDLFRVI